MSDGVLAIVPGPLTATVSWNWPDGGHDNDATWLSGLMASETVPTSAQFPRPGTMPAWSAASAALRAAVSAASAAWSAATAASRALTLAWRVTCDPWASALVTIESVGIDTANPPSMTKDRVASTLRMPMASTSLSKAPSPTIQYGLDPLIPAQ